MLRPKSSNQIKILCTKSPVYYTYIAYNKYLLVDVNNALLSRLSWRSGVENFFVVDVLQTDDVEFSATFGVLSYDVLDLLQAAGVTQNHKVQLVVFEAVVHDARGEVLDLLLHFLDVFGWCGGNIRHMNTCFRKPID